MRQGRCGEVQLIGRGSCTAQSPTLWSIGAGVVTSSARPAREHDYGASGGASEGGSRPLPNTIAVREPPFALTPRVSARVELALESAFRRHAAAVTELRAAIGACVEELQQQGMLPEAMVVTMRAFMQHTVSHPSLEHPVAARAADLFMDEIIRWSILAYYPATILPASARRGRPGDGT